MLSQIILSFTYLFTCIEYRLFRNFRSGFRLDISLRRKVVSNAEKRDEIHSWFMITKFDSSLTKVQGQTEVDPNFLDMQKVRDRSSMRIKRKMPKNLAGAKSQLLVKFEMMDFPSEIFGLSNGTMLKLPQKRTVTFRELYVDYVGISSDSEKRVRIGEHSGTCWVLPPIVVLMTDSTSRQQERLNHGK